MPCNLSYAISEEAEKKAIEKCHQIIFKKVASGALSPENAAIAMDISVEEVLVKLEKYKKEL